MLKCPHANSYCPKRLKAATLSERCCSQRFLRETPLSVPNQRGEWEKKNCFFLFFLSARRQVRLGCSLNCRKAIKSGRRRGVRLCESVVDEIRIDGRFVLTYLRWIFKSVIKGGIKRVIKEGGSWRMLYLITKRDDFNGRGVSWLEVYDCVL